ncbi:unnamed protein product, partial [Vitis vinifera]
MSSSQKSDCSGHSVCECKVIFQLKASLPLYSSHFLISRMFSLFVCFAAPPLPLTCKMDATLFSTMI